MVKKKENGWCLYQSGYGIFGVGKTIEKAEDNAREWLDPPEDADKAELASNKSSEMDGNLYLRECSNELIEEVHDHGGQISWDIDGNGIMQKRGK